MASVEVPVPEGMTPEVFRRYVRQVTASPAATARIAAVLERTETATGPATAAQLAAVEQLWRHLVTDYGVYRSTDIARLRGASPANRSVATNLAKTHGLIGLTRGHAKVYPTFEFRGSEVHPAWRAVSGPLVRAGWEGPDILLWMVSANPALGGREPATLLTDGGEVGELIALAEAEARGVW